MGPVLLQRPMAYVLLALATPAALSLGRMCPDKSRIEKLPTRKWKRHMSSADAVLAVAQAQEYLNGLITTPARIHAWRMQGTTTLMCM